MSPLVRLGGDVLCLGMLFFLELLGCSIPKLDVSAIHSYILQFLSDFVSVLRVFVASLSTIVFVIEKFFSEAWNLERKMPVRL